MQDDFEVLISQQEYKTLMGVKSQLVLVEQQLKTGEARWWEAQEEMEKCVEKLAEANNTIKDLSVRCIKLTKKVMMDEERADQQEELALRKERQLLTKLMTQERERGETARERDLERQARNRWEKQVQELKSQVVEMQRQRDLAKGEVSQLQRKNKYLQGQRREREMEVESMIVLNGSLTQDKEQMEKHINDMLRERERKEAEIQATLIRQKQMKERIQQLEERNGELTKEVDTFNKEIMQLKEETTHMKRELTQRLDNMKEMKNEIDQLTACSTLMKIQNEAIVSQLAREKEERVKWYQLYTQSNNSRRLLQNRVDLLLQRQTTYRKDMHQLKKDQQTLKQTVTTQILQISSMISSKIAQIPQQMQPVFKELAIFKQECQEMIDSNQLLSSELIENNNHILQLQNQLCSHLQTAQRNLEKEEETQRALIESEIKLLTYVWAKLQAYLYKRMENIPNDLDRTQILREEFKHLLRSLRQPFKAWILTL